MTMPAAHDYRESAPRSCTGTPIRAREAAPCRSSRRSASSRSRATATAGTSTKRPTPISSSPPTTLCSATPPSATSAMRPRMWLWAMTMGLRKFQEMVFTGRPFTAAEMYDCNFVNSVVARTELEAEVAKYAKACALSRPTDTVFMQKTFFEIMKQYQGEYMGSMLSAWLESMGGQLRDDVARKLGTPARRRWTRAQHGRQGQRQCRSRRSGG